MTVALDPATGVASCAGCGWRGVPTSTGAPRRLIFVGPGMDDYRRLPTGSPRVEVSTVCPACRK